MMCYLNLARKVSLLKKLTPSKTKDLYPPKLRKYLASNDIISLSCNLEKACTQKAATVYLW